MKPRSTLRQTQMDRFHANFDQILNSNHPLILLADKIDWERFDAAFAECYCPDFEAPGKSIRRMVGLHYLKHAFNVSDESVVERWVENPYWQRNAERICLSSSSTKGTASFRQTYLNQKTNSQSGSNLGARPSRASVRFPAKKIC